MLFSDDEFAELFFGTDRNIHAVDENAIDEKSEFSFSDVDLQEVQDLEEVNITNH